MEGGPKILLRAHIIERKGRSNETWGRRENMNLSSCVRSKKPAMDLCSWFESRYAHFDLNPNTLYFPQPFFFFLSKCFPQWCPRTASQRIGATHLIISGKFSSFSKNFAKIVSGCAPLLLFSFWMSLNGLIFEAICLLFNWECG